MKIFDELEQVGFIAQTTNKEDIKNLLNNEKQKR